MNSYYDWAISLAPSPPVAKTKMETGLVIFSMRMKQSSSQGKARAKPFMYFSINLHKTSLQDEHVRNPHLQITAGPAQLPNPSANH